MKTEVRETNVIWSLIFDSTHLLAWRTHRTSDTGISTIPLNERHAPKNKSIHTFTLKSQHEPFGVLFKPAQKPTAPVSGDVSQVAAICIHIGAAQHAPKRLPKVEYKSRRAAINHNPLSRPPLPVSLFPAKLQRQPHQVPRRCTVTGNNLPKMTPLCTLVIVLEAGKQANRLRGNQAVPSFLDSDTFCFSF